MTELLGPWQQVLTTTTGNAQTVFAASQQALTTLSGGIAVEFSQLLTSPATAFGNLQNALQSVALVGAPSALQSAVVNHTLGGVTTIAGDGPDAGTLVPDVHLHIYQGLVGVGDFAPPTGPAGQFVSALTNFAASPLSGVLIGFAGPIVSPGVQLLNNAGAIATDLTGGNPAAALTELINTPADLTNAFFNGATLNLDPLAPVFSPFVSAGDAGGEQLTGLSIAFGGLFSPGQVINGVNGPMYYGTGGSLFNSLGMDLSLIPPDDGAGDIIHVPAIPVGPIGATAGLIDIFGQALGGSLLG
ncbi:outer membrane porin GjpA [Mycobacterium alsense]|uniref:Outer membrane porin GjpA n=1 Tax=Mycobacterium alsense TaxID=324058 RepID=A0AA41XMK0_9MYCO|nr:outer membrane porin GjpA [Mycobacterium alsense]MCV7378378.1 outer membrane porin GjpA [Mycobacterium alsense]